MNTYSWDGLNVVCQECGRVIAHLFPKFLELKKKKQESTKNTNEEMVDNRDIISALGLTDRYCCFFHLMTYPMGLYEYT